MGAPRVSGERLTAPRDPEGGSIVVEIRLIDLRAVPADAPLLLDAAEHARASRFRHADDARRWIAARASLRLVLGARLDAEPAALTFTHGPFGKPALAGAAGSALQFNLSHSGDRAVIALIAAADASVPPPVGVDVEAVRPLPELDALVAAHFSARERDAWRALDEGARLHAFHRAWTRKEACVKALGVGIGEALDRIEVADGAPPRVGLTAADGTLAGDAWSVRDLDAGPGYVAAVAVPCAAIEVRVIGDAPDGGRHAA